MQENSEEKSNFLDTVRKRIIYFADTVGGGRTLFMEVTGMKKGIFDPKDIDRAVGSDKIAKILDFYQNLRGRWLLLGEGEMLYSEQEEKNSNFLASESAVAYEAIKTTPDKLKKGIPLVTLEAIGGFGNMEFAIKEQDIQSFYEIPDFINTDFMIRVKGSSMYPKYNSGDVVACRIIRESQFIQWNKVHVIATTEQGILIKRLKKSSNEDYYLAVSDNKDYEPFEIPKTEITGLAIVIGVVRLE